MINRRFRAAELLLLVMLVSGGLFVSAVQPSGSLATQTSATREATAATPQPEASPDAAGTPRAIDSQTAWLQIGPGGGLIARATSDEGCPEIVIDGTSAAMGVRAEPTADFPVTVCETAVPPNASSIQVGNTPLQLPAADPQRILIIGDSGCRLRGADDFQACNDPASWPFAPVAEQGAAWNPDLIIHVGDYVYREQACPTGNSGCAGSPHGDTWAAWQADFFTPASPLLDAAPWIFLRGNHEDCNRNGEGWFRFLDPRTMPATCREFTDPYAVNIGDQLAIVMDAASAQDITPDDESTAAFREQFGQVEQLLGNEPAWLLTHKAVWSLGDDSNGNPVEWTTATFTSAGYLQPPAAVELILAGHVHQAQLLHFTEESGRPVEVISGHGGTQQEWFGTGSFSGRDLGDEALIEGVRYVGFGFTALEWVDEGWRVSVEMVDGTAAVSCLIEGKSLDCTE